MASFELSYPDLRDLDKKQMSAEEWRQLLDKTCERLLNIIGESKKKSLNPVFMTGLALLGYPRARDALIAQGRSAEEVGAMPVSQVILIYSMQTYKEMRDDLLKWAWLPYSVAYKGMRQAEEKYQNDVQAGREVLPIGSFLLPAIMAAKAAEARTDRNIAALQTLEAIRLYAASHNGKLPESLNDITEVPVPLDPIRGEPFVYYRNERGAMLESPAGPLYQTLRYEIQLDLEGGKP
jgi:hypothetical protein